jgi:pimeloyl-ACP methyl ester carboxylesterase
MPRPVSVLIAVVAVVTMTSAACGGDDTESVDGASSAASDSAPQGSPSTTAALESTVFEADLDGRRLTGSCSGSSDEGEPTVLLEPGLGNTPSQLSAIQAELSAEVHVCSYDRAGLGRSDPAPGERTFGDAVADLEAVVEESGAVPPYVLVGQSLGANLVYRYAQLHPDEVSGFVSMNPVPPYTTWIERARAVMTPDELQTGEVEFYEGANDESLDLTGSQLMLDEPLDDGITYSILYAEDCSGDFCDRVRPVLEEVTAELAEVGTGGSFVSVEGAGHEIFASDLDAVMAEIEPLLSST